MRELMTPRLLTSAAATLLCLSACGGGAADPAQALQSAKQSVQAGDHEAALKSFQEVAGNSSADAGARYQAMRDLVACEAYVNGDAGATTAFDKLNAEFADRLDVNVLAKIGEDVAGAGCIEAALHIIEVATAKAGDDETQRKTLDGLVAIIQKSGGDEAMEKLRSLGYVGN